MWMSQVFTACNSEKIRAKIFYAEGDVEENTQQGGHILNSTLNAGQI